MLAYREDGRDVETHRELARLMRRAATAGDGRDAALTCLIEIGMFEAAVVDALSPERDGWERIRAKARGATLEAARAWLAAGSPTPFDATAVSAALDRLGSTPLPPAATLRVPEGFAYYALYPETYVESARILHEDYAPTRACVIGLRSIGTTLAAVVHAALESRGCAAWSCTLRPREHPFARDVRLGDTLADALRAEAARGAIFLVVDEGPGLSGSSFASAAEALSQIGVPSHRVVFLSSWDPSPGQLNSAAGQRAWSAHRRITVDATSIGISPGAFDTSGVVDYSAGKWRPAVYDDEREWPAIVPAHERWKVHVPAAERLLKFVGLGRFG